jgi:hypothetical protein
VKKYEIEISSKEQFNDIKQNFKKRIFNTDGMPGSHSLRNKKKKLPHQIFQVKCKVTHIQVMTQLNI